MRMNKFFVFLYWFFRSTNSVWFNMFLFTVRRINDWWREWNEYGGTDCTEKTTETSNSQTKISTSMTKICCCFFVLFWKREIFMDLGNIIRSVGNQSSSRKTPTIKYKSTFFSYWIDLIKKCFRFLEKNSGRIKKSAEFINDDDDNNDDDDEADKEDDNEADEVDEARDDTTETTTEAVAPVRSSAPKKARWSQSPKVSRRSLYQRYGHSLTLVSLQCRWRDWPTTRSKCASGDAPRVVGPVLAHAFRVKFIGSTMSWSRVPRTPSPYESLSACRW